MSRVLLIAEARFSRREHAFLRRIEIALTAEGWRVLRAVPESSFDIQPLTLTSVVPYREAHSRFGRNAAMQRFVEDLRAATPAINPDQEGALFEIIHAFGQQCWERAAYTAALTGAALVVELTSASDIREARHLERLIAHRHADLALPVWCTPNARMHAFAQQFDLAGQLALTPWGVHTPGHARPDHPEDQPVAISVVCSGAEPRAIPPLIDAYARLGDDRDRAMLFIDAAASQRDPGLWGHVERLGVLERVTFVADMESRRELVLETDVLAIPEQMGELRTILLDAMASGMLVVSRRDPLIEATGAPGVAMLIDEPSAEAWHACFRTIIDDPRSLRSFGETARERVREDRPAHRHIGAIIDAYDHALAPAPLPMDPSGLTPGAGEEPTAG